jgi:hypothetical protein
VAEVSWDPYDTGLLLLLRMDETDIHPVPPAWSPVVGRAPVIAGQRYRLAVGLAGADFLFEGPFVLTTAIE